MPLNGPKANFGVITLDNGKVNYELKKFEYDFNELEKYYKKTTYYNTVDTWAKISLMNIKDGYDYTKEFIQRVYYICKENNIDTSEGIPNDIWLKEYEIFIKQKHLEKYIN